MPPCDTFAELSAMLRAFSGDKSKLWIVSDEGIVRVFYQDEMIFSDDEVSFVNAFFAECGFTIDERYRGG